MTLYYLAYGSNLHPLRIQQRVPSARLEYRLALPGWRVGFEKRGQDDSAKCNLEHVGAPAQAYAAVYRIAREDKPLLDECEGCGRGYRDVELVLDGPARALPVFTYMAQPEFVAAALRPFEWYRDLVVAGAACLGFPAAYVRWLESVPAIADPDGARDTRHRDLLQRMLESLQVNDSVVPLLHEVRA